jgi:asparagine synthase (glutamine-hydrolysing)
MCGICGTFHYASNQPVAEAEIRGMMDTIVHRGPDDAGVHLDGNLGLGFRRLAILDLSPAGHQPMSDPTGQVWVAFNGEIYNFKELRAELEGKGHRFRSHCDTEVIVLGFLEWGDAVLDHLEGMFGLAVWEPRRRRLLLARDQLGIKPVYYTLQGGTLHFGSEIRPILAALPTHPALDLEAAAEFLRYRYTPAPRTLHAGIHKLAAGEKLVVHQGTATLSRYYTFAPEPFAPVPRAAEAAEQLLALYENAVRRHLISDVPVGLLLSGGLDSGLLLGLMAKHGKAWPTFSVGYGTSFRDDELIDAARTAELFGATHHEVRIDRAQFEAELPRIVGAVEEPVASSSIVPMYFVCGRARQDVKVALIGQGPDELCGGYTRHLGVRYGHLWRNLPGPVRRAASSLLGRLPRAESLRRGLYSLGEAEPLRRYQQVFSLANEATLQGLFRPGHVPAATGPAPVEGWEALRPQLRALDELNAFQMLEVRSSLPDELLLYGDKLSMAHALEARVPYLDRPLVEHLQRLPASFKVRHGVRKWIHRQVCRKFLPAEILARKKRGFAVNVVDDWFRGSLQGQVNNCLADPQSQLYQHLDPQAVAALQRRHATGEEDQHKLLFSLVVLEQWLRQNAASRPAAQSKPAIGYRL